MKIGYARVSTIHQNLARQLAALKAQDCDRVFAEKATGSSTKKRPQLEKALSALGAGDILIVAEWDRATRSMVDGIAIIARIQDQGATLRVLDRASLDLTTPTGRAMMALLSAFYEEERVRIVARAKAGTVEAMKRGVKFGPKYKLKGKELQTALAMKAEGKSVRSIGRALKLHHATISKTIKIARKSLPGAA